MPSVYIGIGSNLGNRQENCLAAVEALARSGLKIISRSGMIETEPWGMTDQPQFINMVAEVSACLLPHQLLDLLLRIETEMGRDRTVRWGPRIIDLDILLYDDLIIKTKELTIPHPFLHERDFVLRPLAEIAPNKVHPLLKKTAGKLLEELTVKNQQQKI
ncbi:MAG: 2-amino-4-hydroxy-6-hydroxymethyldihydropteridine diphosphokinase [Thermodesulfovibrionales bacterium]